jgi:putative FmdB family regulatory protein
MPLYEYYCSDCRTKFELLVSHKHADDVVCTKCHSEKIRRLLSVFTSQRGGSEDSVMSEMPTTLTGGGCCGSGGCGCH